jgi:hypothetical protein
MRRVLGLTLIIATAAAATTAPKPAPKAPWPPTLPAWPATPVTQFPIGFEGNPGEIFAGDLDGKPGDELAEVASNTDEDQQVTVLGMRGGKMVRLARASFPFGHDQAIGDVDGDGRAELLGMGPKNEVLAVSLRGDKLESRKFPAPTDRLVGTLACADARGTGSSELVLGYQRQTRFDGGDDPEVNELAGYRLRNGAWSLLWKQPVKPLSFWIIVRPGTWLSGKPELAMEHGPSDVSAATHEVWRWDGKRFASVARHTSDSSKGGMHFWVGSIPGKGIISRTVYLSPKGDEAVTRGEVLEWKAGRAVPRYRLAGAPMAVGSFTGPGQRELVVQPQHDADRFLLQRAPK